MIGKGKTSYRLGIVGYPLEHSLSPHLHQAALAARRLEGTYHFFLVPPDSKRTETLGAVLGRLRADELQGLNVTLPYKQTVMPLLDQLSPAARVIGAVNILYCEGGKLIGENTDAGGFHQDLERVLRIARNSGWIYPPSKQPVALVLGAGGGARAVVYVLLRDGWRVVLNTRRLEKAQSMVKDFASFSSGSSLITCRDLRALDEEIRNTLSLVVNATPLGMWPEVSASPWPTDLPLPQRAIIYDLVYNPPETVFMRQARSAGLLAFNGLGMLIEQAALAFEIWTGLAAPRQEMRQAVIHFSNRDIP